MARVRGSDLASRLVQAANDGHRTIRVSNLNVWGPVDLAGLSTDAVVHMVKCKIRRPLQLDMTRLGGLVIEDSDLSGGLDLTITKIEGDVAILRTRILGRLERRSHPTMHFPIESDHRNGECCLSLRGTQVGGDLLLADCSVNQPNKLLSFAIHARHLRTGGKLTLTNCEVWGEAGFPSCVIGGDLQVEGGSYTKPGESAVRLSGSKIEGSVFVTPSETRSVRIDGSLQLNGIEVADLVRIVGAEIGPARMNSMGGIPWSVAMRAATVGSDVVLERGLSIDGGLTIDGSAFGGKFDCHAELTAGRKRAALSANGIKSAGNFTLTSSKPVCGPISVLRSEVESDLDFRGVTVAASENSNDAGIDLSGTNVRGSILGAELVTDSACRLTGVDVRRDLDLRGAKIDGGPVQAIRTTGEAKAGLGVEEIHYKWSLFADALSVGGTVDLSECDLDGGIWLRGAKLGGRLDLADTKIRNQGRPALSLSLAQIAGTVRADRLVAQGLIEMNRARIEGRVTLSEANLLWFGSWPANRRGSALEMISTFVGGGMLFDWESAEPFVDLVDSRTPALADVPQNWPSGGMDWAGFRYERFAGRGDAPTNHWASSERITQLRKQNPLDLGVYKHAADLFRSHGYSREADEIVVAGQREARKELQLTACRSRARTWPALAWDWVFDKSVRYGLRPSRALVGMFVLILLVWATVFPSYSARNSSLRAASQDDRVYVPSGQLGNSSSKGTVVDGATGCDDGRVRCFSPHLFAIDTVVPILDLGQARTWYVNPIGIGGLLLQVWIATASILGWVLSTLFALSFSRLGERRS